MENIKACPFCGGKAKIIAKGLKKCFVFVECEICGAHTKGTFLGEFPAYEVYEFLEDERKDLQDLSSVQKEIERWELRKE